MKRLIYSFEFSDNSVYIGLTSNPKKRKTQHLNSKNNTTVFRHFTKTKLLPTFLIKSKFLNEKLAAFNEMKILEKYKRNGWKILNLNKTGSLGGRSELFWTKKRVLINAKKFLSKSEWSLKSSGAYDAALKKGWHRLATRHMKRPVNCRLKWTLLLCQKESKKYKTRSEWKSKSYGSYQAAQTYGWLNKCSNHMKYLVKPKNYWNFKRCLIDSKKHKNRSEWCKKSKGAYNSARLNNWLVVFFG